MKIANILLITLFLTFLSGCSSFNERSIASEDDYEKITPQFQTFLDVESKHNPGKAKFDQKPLDLSFVEIEINDEQMYLADSHDQWMVGPQGAKGPDAFIFDHASYLPKDVKKYFYNVKDGKKYFRFYFHPYDTSQKTNVLEYLSSKSIPHEVLESGKLKAYSTASKSLIAYDKDSGRAFSLKTSTNGTVQGTDFFESRPYPTRWSYMVRMLSDSFYRVRHKLQSVSVAFEPLATGIPSIDQSNSVRLMEDVSKGKLTHISGFVFNDLEKREELAAKAGMSVDEFWTEAFRIKGRAMAEMGLYLGILVTSNHAQNFRWEIGNDGKLTGRVVFLDLSDVSPIKNIHSALGNETFIDRWNKYVGNTNAMKTDDRIRFSNFFRGDHNSSIEEKWHTIMGEAAIDRASEILNIDKQILEEKIVSEYSPKSWSIDINSDQRIKDAFNIHKENLSSIRINNCQRSIVRILED